MLKVLWASIINGKSHNIFYFLNIYIKLKLFIIYMFQNFLIKSFYKYSSIRDRINQKRTERLKNLLITT